MTAIKHIIGGRLIQDANKISVHHVCEMAYYEKH